MMYAGKMLKLSNALPRMDGHAGDGSLQSFCWPGGYPIYYVTKGNDILCPECAQRQDDRNREEILEGLTEGVCATFGDSDIIVSADLNYEDPDLFCEECSQRIPSAYAEPEEN